MAVAVKDTGTAVYNTTAVTQTYTFTVSSGATLAVFFIVQDVTQSITSVTWDSGGTNQACTLIGSKSDPTASLGAVYLYGRINPTVGTNKTLSVVNGVTTGESAEMQSYSGTVTSSVAAACTNVLTANGTTAGTQSVGTAAQSGANGDYYISGYMTPGGISALSNITIYNLSPAGNDAAGNGVASTGTSISLTATIPTSTWAAVSCDIVAGSSDVLQAQIWL
ncbi:MAG TPA: hypothetical protein VNZ45_08045 [Bacteroidia bacterium]|jgi:hypothetical protein|nr:hypothetical protein [Bacteroidia bacterium]